MKVEKQYFIYLGINSISKFDSQNSLLKEVKRYYFEIVNPEHVQELATDKCYFDIFMNYN